MLAESSRATTVPYADILNLRASHYRLSPELKVKSRAEAVRFIDQAGVVLLFPGDNLPLPDLWSAVNGFERQIPHHHHDWALGRTWEWKDDIPDRKEAWYGKIIRGKPAFISFRDLPAVYALSPNYGELDDYLEAYNDGLLSKEARDIYEVLLAEGPLPTNTLRKAAGLYGKGEIARRFEKAIVELQSGLKIVKSGTSDANRWKYCYVYDLLLRWAPDLAEQSRQYTGRTAMRHLISRYLESHIAAPRYIFSKLFGWDAAITERVLNEMVEDGTLQEVRVMGGPGPTPKAKPPAEGELWFTKG